MPSDEFEYAEEDQTLDAPETTEEVEEEEDTVEEDAAGNPALAELYDVLPKSLHGLIEPVINKWQAGIDQQFEKIAPYRKYVDAGVAPDVIEASLELAAEISANPKAVYDELAARYGWQQAEKMVEQALETEKTFNEEDTDFEVDPTSAELKALKAEIEAMRSERLSEAEAREAAQMETEIEATLSAIQSEFGDFDSEAVVRRAMLLSEEYPNAELQQLISAAHEQYTGEIKAMQAAAKRAPKVAGGTGNSIPAAVPKVLSSREDRVAAIEEIAKRALAGMN